MAASFVNRYPSVPVGSALLSGDRLLSLVLRGAHVDRDGCLLRIGEACCFHAEIRSLTVVTFVRRLHDLAWSPSVRWL